MNPLPLAAAIILALLPLAAATILAARGLDQNIDHQDCQLDTCPASLSETGADRADISAERAERFLLMGSALSDNVATLALFAMLAFDSGFEVAVLVAVAMGVGFLCRLGYVFAYKHSRKHREQAQQGHQRVHFPGLRRPLQAPHGTLRPRPAGQGTTGEHPQARRP